MSDILMALGIGVGSALGLPLVFLGVQRLREMIDTFMKVKAGAVESWVVLPNRRVLKGLVKPDGKNLKIKVNGKEKTLKYDEKKVIYEGNKPIVMYMVDATNPYDFFDSKFKPDLDPNYYDDLLVRMRNIGMRMKKKEDQLILLAIGVVGLITLISLGIGFLNYTAILKIPV